MRTIGLACVALIAFGGLTHALQSPELQQKVAAAKEAAARNQQALRSYSWITKTSLSVKGEVKNTKIESSKYGPDGTVQNTELTEPPPPPPRQRGLRGRIVERKTAEMKKELEASVALVQSYVPPDGEKLQAVIAAYNVSLSQAGPDAVAIRFADYQKSGDSLTLTFDSEVKALRHVAVDTWLDEPDNQVTLDVNFESMSDGINYAARTLLMIPDSQIEVQIENSNYQRVVQ